MLIKLARYFNHVCTGEMTISNFVAESLHVNCQLDAIQNLIHLFANVVFCKFKNVYGTRKWSSPE